MPVFSMATCSLGGHSMRTGRRCTTLTQLPVAFCAGISENYEPVAAPMLATLHSSLSP